LTVTEEGIETIFGAYFGASAAISVGIIVYEFVKSKVRKVYKAQELLKRLGACLE
jgi:hypothetical protein